VSSSMNLDEGEVAAGLNVANFLGFGRQLELLKLGSSIVLLALPLKSFGPSLVAQPVANVISITLKLG
jgi:hypothetical protein